MKTKKAEIGSCGHKFLRPEGYSNPECLECLPKHSRTPWAVEGDGRGDIQIKSGGQLVARDLTQDDAELIVRAVNAHEYLLKSAKLSMELLVELRRTMDEGHWFADDLNKIGEALASAIAKAEGK